jgi:hypothetical protein
MFILIASITFLASRGQCTVQIPGFDQKLRPTTFRKADEIPSYRRHLFVEVPDDHVCLLSQNGTPCVDGSMYLTSKGYERFRKDFMEAWEIAIDDRHTTEPFEVFHQAICDHFKKVERALFRRTQKLQKQIEALNNFTV